MVAIFQSYRKLKLLYSLDQHELVWNYEISKICASLMIVKYLMKKENNKFYEKLCKGHEEAE